jgi:hypothetical protein
MKKTILLLSFFLLVGFKSFAQIDTVYFSVSKSFQSAKDKSKPAELNVTWPEDGVDSYSIDGALGVNFELADYSSIISSIEWHKNNLIEKEQDNLSLGLDFTTILNPLGDLKNSLTIGAKYNNNKIEKLKSMRVRGLFMPLIKLAPKKDIFKILTPLTGNKWGIFKGKVSLTHNISGALEYSNDFKAENALLNGSIARVYYSYQLKLYLFAKAKDPKNERVYFDFNYEGRTEFSNTTETDTDEYISYIEYGVSYVLAKRNDKDVISMRLARVEGENPWTGLKNQEFWKLTFTLKI